MKIPQILYFRSQTALSCCCRSSKQQLIGAISNSNMYSGNIGGATTFYVNMFVCLSFVFGSNPFLARFVFSLCVVCVSSCFWLLFLLLHSTLHSLAKCCLLFVIVGVVAIFLLFFPTLLVPLLNIHLLFTLLATFEQQQQ